MRARLKNTSDSFYNRLSSMQRGLKLNKSYIKTCQASDRYGFGSR